MKEIIHGSVCVDCIAWAYNGEDTEHGTKMMEYLQADSLMIEIDVRCECSASDLWNGDCQCDPLDDHYFSWKRCDGCASDLGGDRWDVSIGINY